MAVPIAALQAAAPSAVIELFILELNLKQHGVASTYRFHAGTSLNATGAAASAETDSLLLEDSPFNDFYILSYGEASSSGVGVDRLGIGVDVSGTAPGNVHIRRLTFFPQRLPNSTLVALTQ